MQAQQRCVASIARRGRPDHRNLVERGRVDDRYERRCWRECQVSRRWSLNGKQVGSTGAAAITFAIMLMGPGATRVTVLKRGLLAVAWLVRCMTALGTHATMITVIVDVLSMIW